MAQKHKNQNFASKLRALVVVLIIAAIGTAVIIQSSAATTTGVYAGVFAGGDSTLADVHNFEAISGKKVAIVNTFSSWGAADNTLKVNMLNNIRSNGSLPMVTWEPWNTAGGVNQPAYSLQSIINGSHDSYIRAWAQSVKVWNRPLFLRFAHEMNGNWYPWSEQVNGNKPGEYVQAWRHVHQIFSQVGANKVTWVWCVNKLYGGSTDIQTLYPGDLFSDWTAFDAYNRGTSTGLTGNQYAAGTWQDFGTLVKPTYQALGSLAPGKPQMLAEYGTVEQGGDKADWFTKALKYELKNNYPRIKAVVYFNQNKIYDNRIDTSPTSLAAYAGGIGLSYYASNNYSNTDSKSGGITGKIYPLLYQAQVPDIIGPFASIVAPYGTVLPASSSQTIVVDAHDFSDVARVDVYANGTPVCSDATDWYGCSWTTPSTTGPVLVRAVAYDKLGNASTTSTTYQIN